MKQLNSTAVRKCKKNKATIATKFEGWRKEIRTVTFLKHSSTVTKLKKKIKLTFLKTIPAL